MCQAVPDIFVEVRKEFPALQIWQPKQNSCWW